LIRTLRRDRKLAEKREERRVRRYTARVLEERAATERRDPLPAEDELAKLRATVAKLSPELRQLLADKFGLGGREPRSASELAGGLESRQAVLFARAGGAEKTARAFGRRAVSNGKQSRGWVRCSAGFGRDLVIGVSHHARNPSFSIVCVDEHPAVNVRQRDPMLREQFARDIDRDRICRHTIGKSLRDLQGVMIAEMGSKRPSRNWGFQCSGVECTLVA
jgi:hypothetical protein